MLDDKKLHRVDVAYQIALMKHPVLANRWLLTQTLHTSPLRRSLLRFIRFPANGRILDAGTGFAALPIDLAGQFPLEIHGVDVDAETLSVANEILTELRAEDYFHPQSSVELQQGDVYKLPYPDNYFDVVTANFIYQHLAAPDVATLELQRVMKPGGQIWIMDVDDQFRVAYPAMSEAFQTLHNAFSEVQSLLGGDRQVGRKLPSYLQTAGFKVLGSVIQPQSQFAVVSENDFGKQFTLERFQSTRADIIAHGLMTAATFDAYMKQFSSEEAIQQFHASAELIVTGQKLG